MEYSGLILSTTINMITAVCLGIYIGVPAVSFPFVAAKDVYRGFVGEPAEMNYRPNWQNFALECGEGADCDD